MGVEWVSRNTYASWVVHECVYRRIMRKIIHVANRFDALGKK